VGKRETFRQNGIALSPHFRRGSSGIYFNFVWDQSPLPIWRDDRNDLSCPTAFIGHPSSFLCGWIPLTNRVRGQLVLCLWLRPHAYWYLTLSVNQSPGFHKSIVRRCPSNSRLANVFASLAWGREPLFGLIRIDIQLRPSPTQRGDASLRSLGTFFHDHGTLHRP